MLTRREPSGHPGELPATAYGFGDIVRVEFAGCDGASGLFCVVGHSGSADVYLSPDLECPSRDDWRWIMHGMRVSLVQRADPGFSFAQLWSEFWGEQPGDRACRLARRAEFAPHPV